MIRNWYNQIPHSALKTKREITKYINWQQFTKGTRGKPNEQLFPKQGVIRLPKIYKIVTNIIGEPKYKQARTSNNKDPQQKYRFGTVSIKILGGLNRFYGYPTSPSASVMAQNIQLFGPREGFLTHQWIITGNK